MQLAINNIALFNHWYPNLAFRSSQEQAPKFPFHISTN